MEIEVAAVVIKADYDQAMSGAIGEDEVVIGAREHLIYERRDERGTEVVEQGERAGCLSAITGRGGLGEALAVGAAGCLVGFLLDDIDGAVHGLLFAELFGREAAGRGGGGIRGDGAQGRGVGEQ